MHNVRGVGDESSGAEPRSDTASGPILIYHTIPPNKSKTNERRSQRKETKYLSDCRPIVLHVWVIGSSVTVLYNFCPLFWKMLRGPELILINVNERFVRWIFIAFQAYSSVDVIVLLSNAQLLFILFVSLTRVPREAYLSCSSSV